jgi:hypothetical protein
MIFDATTSEWQPRHRDPRVQRMAECFLASYLEKRKRHDVQAFAS